MINWFDMPAEGLSNGGLFEVKELEVTENGTYEQSGEMYNKVIVNVEGGGTSWQTVFEGSVTTEEDSGFATGTVEASVSADTVKVTFNGTEYECSKNEDDSYGAPWNDSTDAFDWSTYPFNFNIHGSVLMFNTESAGTYTLKIEEPQSGGSSDFSTATLVIDNIAENPALPEIFVSYVAEPLWDGQIASDVGVPLEEFPATIKVIMYKGKARLQMPIDTTYVALDGDITRSVDNEFTYYITGDCKITLNMED